MPLKKIGQFFKRLFTNIFKGQYKIFKENSELAVRITNTLKDIINSPVTDIVTALIPGDIDDKIKEKLRDVLNKVAFHISIAHQLIEASATNAEAWDALLKHIETLIPTGGSATFWREFALKVNEFLADGELSSSEAAVLAQMVYIEKFKTQE